MKRIITLLALALVCCAVCACSGGPSDDEARAIIEELVERSLVLNEIYFGEGLPYEKTAESAIKEAAAELADKDVGTITYHPVAADAAFTTIDAIKAETEAVFTQSYAAALYEVAFSGIAGETDESGTSIDTVYARYIEDAGVLTVNSLIEPLIGHRTYDYSTLRVTRSTDRFITATVQSALDGAPDVEVTVELTNTEDGWRLDSATY